uniref:Si:ch211-15d5.11 n=1 Tax=Fundulus heteroclitus TaxID=8078 RepID=A0A3Q2NVG4_FUNHE
SHRRGVFIKSLCCFCRRRKGKAAKSIFQKLAITKSQGGSLRGEEEEEESPPVLVSAAPSALPGPTLSLSEEVPAEELPPRTVGRTWRLAYSTSRHGASLKSLYRKLSTTDSPVLLVIKDALDELFGAFLSDPLRPSEKFYGTGETFLFMLHPRFKCFRWTGENFFFIKGDLDCFAVGGGSGHFGLWVDENLYLGRSSPCYTFNNCCLSETDDFRIMELEVWTFS